MSSVDGLDCNAHLVGGLVVQVCGPSGHWRLTYLARGSRATQVHKSIADVARTMALFGYPSACFGHTAPSRMGSGASRGSGQARTSPLPHRPRRPQMPVATRKRLVAELPIVGVAFGACGSRDAPPGGQLVGTYRASRRRVAARPSPAVPVTCGRDRRARAQPHVISVLRRGPPVRARGASRHRL